MATMPQLVNAMARAPGDIRMLLVLVFAVLFLFSGTSLLQVPIIPVLTRAVGDAKGFSIALIVPAICYATIVAFGLYASWSREATV